jgi:hypothetical protein
VEVMKIHRVVTMLGATTTTGKLASDMYDLNYKTYYSEAEKRDIPISHMDFQHMIRAFVKVNDKANYFKKVSEDNFITSVNDLDVISAKDNLIRKLNEKIERLEGIIEEKDETIDKLCEKNKQTGCEYVFSEIPNDEYGKKLTRGMKVYLNDETYTMRVRGQHLKKELYGQGKAYWGQSIEDSTHLRVYINKKNIKWKDIK